jgi:hypothetical protein
MVAIVCVLMPCTAPQITAPWNNWVSAQMPQVIVINDSSDDEEQEQQLLETAPTVQVSRWLHCWERCISCTADLTRALLLLAAHLTALQAPELAAPIVQEALATVPAAEVSGGRVRRVLLCPCTGGVRRWMRRAHNNWWCTPAQEDQELEALAAAAATALAAPVLAIAPSGEVSRCRAGCCGCWLLWVLWLLLGSCEHTRSATTTLQLTSLTTTGGAGGPGGAGAAPAWDGGAAGHGPEHAGGEHTARGCACDCELGACAVATQLVTQCSYNSPHTDCLPTTG